eukprot:s4464_g1.t1
MMGRPWLQFLVDRRRSPKVQQSAAINYDQSNEEDTRGHISDPVRDQAGDDRSFSRSTAKLTPQLFAELTGPGSTFGGGGRSFARSWRLSRLPTILRTCSDRSVSPPLSSRTARRDPGAAVAIGRDLCDRP